MQTLLHSLLHRIYITLTDTQALITGTCMLINTGVHRSLVHIMAPLDQRYTHKTHKSKALIVADSNHRHTAWHRQITGIYILADSNHWHTHWQSNHRHTCRQTQITGIYTQALSNHKHKNVHAQNTGMYR